MYSAILFTDGSVDTKTQIGFGAYLFINDTDLTSIDLKTKIKIKQFENTSSTRLELQTLLWAIDDARLLNLEKKLHVAIYSDSQNIVGLSARRNALEGRDYRSRNGQRLNNVELYRRFFDVLDQCNFQIIKVDGHKRKHFKDDIDRAFTLVDKASRSALREFNRKKSSAE